MSEHILDANGLHSFYGASHILHGVDFTVKKGETIGLMGRNGMGKTTLIKSMLGLVRPRQGAVRVRGVDMTHAAPHAIARKGIAYVPEGRGIFPNLSVRENLIMAARAGVDGRRDWDYDRVLQTFPRIGERLEQRRRTAFRRRAADADHRPRADDQSRPADPRRGHRRPGAADRARDLEHHQNHPRLGHRHRDRGQELRRRHGTVQSQRGAGEGQGGVRRRVGTRNSAGNQEDLMHRFLGV
jgi:ABC-type sugar transport system ATPase subunit